MDTFTTNIRLNSTHLKKGKKMLILTQKKDKIVNIDDISLNGNKINGISMQHPMGLNLAKYDSKDRAQAVFLGLFQYLKSSDKFNITYEMPEN